MRGASSTGGVATAQASSSAPIPPSLTSRPSSLAQSKASSSSALHVSARKAGSPFAQWRRDLNEKRWHWSHVITCRIQTLQRAAAAAAFALAFEVLSVAGSNKCCSNARLTPPLWISSVMSPFFLSFSPCANLLLPSPPPVQHPLFCLRTCPRFPCRLRPSVTHN